MAFSLKGKGKKIAISIAVVLVLEFIAGGLTGWLLGPPWPQYAVMGVLMGYSVWLATSLFRDTPDKAE